MEKEREPEREQAEKPERELPRIIWEKKLSKAERETYRLVEPIFE